MRKFVMNGAVLGSAFSAIAMARRTAKGPRDWRLTLAWLSWGLSAAIAVGTVVERSRDKEIAQARNER